MNSTHEAFSLPTSSPGFSSHPDAFNPDLLNTPDPESATSPTYTYPPPSGGGSYGYVPTSAGSRSRPTSLLPLHNTPSSPSYPYPPLPQTWNRLRTWLSREYPELGDTLNYGIISQDLTQIEMQFGFPLPSVVRESYLTVDGQEAESAAGCSEGLFFGLTLLPLEDVLEEWRFWREVDEDPATGANERLREVMQSIPPGWVRKNYSQRGWVPLIADKAGNYVGVDLNPGEGGSVGQVIVFGRDFDTKVVLWRGDGPDGWAKWLASFAEELESGEGYELGQNEASEGSEDDVGYESYFFDGSGRGQGDGGGESGPGGLRLSGEYRGWNVLEAWADRSVRKWYEAGLLPEDSSAPLSEEPKKMERLGLGVLDLATSNGSGSEVPIPVLADVSEAETSAIAGPATTHTTRPSLPTISVTKAPAPMPVELPTPHDLIALPSPPDSTRSSEDIDLEAGHGMREIDHEQEIISMTTRKSPQHSAKNSQSDTPALTPRTSLEPLAADSSVTDITDFLSDPASEALITPSSSSSTQEPHATNFVVGHDPEEPEHVESEDLPLDAQSDEPESNPEASATIRLVGGGGDAGTVEATSVPDGEVETEPKTDPLETTSETGPPLPNAAATKNRKHEKHKKSLSSGLKKFGQLGGKRKKDSSSSIKEAA